MIKSTIKSTYTCLSSSKDVLPCSIFITHSDILEKKLVDNTYYPLEKQI